MPTPSENTTVLSNPVEATSSRASFASCPPEEERDRHASYEGRVVSPEPQSGAAGAMLVSVSEHTTTAESLANLEPIPSDAAIRAQSGEDSERPEHIEDAGLLVDSPSPAGSPDAPSDGERLAQTMEGTAISNELQPEYLCLTQKRQRRIPNSTSSFLRPGSKFRGTQQSDRQVYDVQVEIKDVDMAESFLCGYLRIQGLTDDHPTLTTFFEGEIIGPKHLFKTTHPSWGSSEKVDLQHWARFPPWRPLAKSAKSPNFTLKNYAQREHLFMRWKEYFLVPDHRVKTITGASFEGFYYICFNQCTGNVSGIYFHAKSEKYQQLELQHVDDRGCMGSVEFR